MSFAGVTIDRRLLVVGDLLAENVWARCPTGKRAMRMRGGHDEIRLGSPAFAWSRLATSSTIWKGTPRLSTETTTTRRPSLAPIARPLAQIRWAVPRDSSFRER